MPDKDVLIIRNFTQKLAGHKKQANPLAALSNPNVLGTLGGAAAGGLGAYGLARLMQSEEDRRNGGIMPLVAGLAGAGLGGYGGNALAGSMYPSPEVRPEVPDGKSYNDVKREMDGAGPQKLKVPGAPPTTPVSWAPRGNHPMTPAELSAAAGEESLGADPMNKKTDAMAAAYGEEPRG
jgi:hypothetical protein